MARYARKSPRKSYGKKTARRRAPVRRSTARSRRTEQVVRIVVEGSNAPTTLDALSDQLTKKPGRARF